MNIIKLYDNTELDRTVVAVGNFDGVHIGHAALIEEAVRLARENGCEPAVWTFTDYAPKKDKKHIITAKKRYELFRALGVRLVFEDDFNDVCDMSAIRFVKDVLIKKCGALYAVCGYNFRFGKGAKGDAKMLKTLMERAGAHARIIDEIKINGTAVSSTAVKRALSDGDIALANAMLNRPFSVTLPVIHGRRIGTGLGFPTINQDYPAELTDLRRGVYACRVDIDGVSYKAVSNVGIKPTVGADGVTVETHIIGCDMDLYGREIKVEFLFFIRDERKYDTLRELQEQIKKDVKKAGELL